ncbi:MAG TPA: thioredoxin family protein [Patescibacteria group bacterium]|nr:thioredoxin family protein [Patescibacteria group bacterium]
MKSHTFLILGIVIILAGGAWYFSAQRWPTTENSDDMMGQPTVVVTPGDGAMENDDSRYVVYSPEAFDAAKNKKRVFFFFAPWCPTCVPTDKAFQANLNQIPEDVVLFKTDYDSSTELKKQYSITYQHTFVLVDDNGNEVKKWNGGGMNELVDNTQ